MKNVFLLFGCVLLLAGCSSSKSTSSNNTSSGAVAFSGEGALGKMHAKADPGVLAEIKAQPQQLMSLSAAAASGSNGALAPNQLPQVSQAPFAPPAGDLVSNSRQSSGPDNSPSIWPFNPTPKQSPDASADLAPRIASYGGYGGNSAPPPPSGANTSLVPPPPAVVLSTQAQPVAYGAPVDVYGNPYYPPPSGNPAPGRNPGSLFGSGVNHSSSEDNSSAKETRHVDFVPIMPTGMDTRSAYKQRDDMKLLWKGTLSSSSLQAIAQRDQRIAAELNAISLALPADASRGSLNVSQRQADAIFKSAVVDRRILPEVKKLQLDLAQSYYRYLYAYNKYALAQQTVAARKQEMDYAGDATEKQRAAADWSAARTDAEAATDDMKSAQYELASIAGTQSARLIIGRVSGIAPSADSLAQASDPNSSLQAMSKRHNLLGSLLHASDKVITIKPVDDTANGSKVQVKKSLQSKGGKSHNNSHIPAVAKDLSPAPDPSVASQSSDDSSDASKVSSITSSPVSASSAAGISFQLRDVNVTPRKSILRVSIRNNSSENFSFDPDIVSVTEGVNKLSEAMVRADFDTTKVAPNQEIVGTITIFARPWNDRLSISLADSGKNIQLRR